MGLQAVARLLAGRGQKPHSGQQGQAPLRPERENQTPARLTERGAGGVVQDAGPHPCRPARQTATPN